MKEERSFVEILIFLLFRADQISIIDDLAFAMYQDPEIAAIIRNLDKKKQESVHGRANNQRIFFLKHFLFFDFRRKVRTSPEIQTSHSRIDQSLEEKEKTEITVVREEIVRLC